MNKGLKSYTKQLTQEVGNAKACVNINENDANLHFILPLAKTVGTFPFEVNLIYTHQNRSIKDELFGKGFKIDWFSEIGYNAADMWIINADGSRDEYTDGDFNPETQLTLTKHRDSYGNVDSFYVEDKNGNRKNYGLHLTGYPSSITGKKGRILVDMTALVKSIDNRKGDVVTFTKGDNGLVQEVCYKHNETVILTAYIVYDSADRIIAVSYKKNNVEIAKTKITYTASTVKLEDGVSGEFAEFTYSGNKITSFNDMGGRTTSLTYNGKRTAVSDFTGKKAYVIFDENDLPSYEIDSEFNVVRFEFDKETKMLLSKSEPIQTKFLDGSAIIKPLSEFTREGVSMLQIPFTDEIFNEIIGKNVNMITNCTGTLTAEIPVQGLATDNLTVAVFGKLISGSANLRIMTDNNFETVDFKKCGDAFDLLMLGVNEQRSYKKIKLTITLTNATVYLGNVQIIKKNFGSFYQYDSNGNVTKSGNRGSTEIAYNGNNLPSRSIGVDSTMIDYEYDSKDNLKKATTAYGVTIENEYDADNNPTKMTITNRNGKSIVTQKEYDSERRFVTKEIDSAGNATNMSYNVDGNLKSVTDALGAVAELAYKDNGLISKLIAKKGRESAEAVYTYTANNLLESVTLSNGSKYDFIYNSQNWLTGVKLNGQTVFSFEYDETTGNILRQTYGSGDSFLFSYRSDGLIDSVAYKAVDSEEETRYFYGYNDKKQLFVVHDSFDKYNSFYKFDSEGRVNHAEINDAALNYGYDNLGNMNKLTVEKGGVKVHQTFDTVARSKGSNPDSIMHAFGYENLLTLFDKDAAIRSQKVGYSPVDDFKNLYREGIIPYARVTSTNLLRYVLGMPCYYPQECGFTAFWFKVDTLSRTAHLFTAKSQYNYSLVNAKIVNKKIEVRVVDIKGNSQTVLISKKQIKSGWNFFAINIYNRYDGYGYPDVCEYSITLNEDTQVFKKQDPSINVDFGSNPLYCIGNNSSEDDCLVGKIAALCIAPRKYMSYDNIQRYYRCSKDYLIDNQMVDESVQTVDFGLSSVYTVNSNIQNKFEIAPLHNSVLTLSDKKPVAFDLREVSSADKDRTFNFNKKIKRYAYVADGSMLKYDFGQSTSGTVMLRAYTDSHRAKQYYFECADESGKTLGLYRGEDCYLYIDCNGKYINTGYIVNNDEWYTIGLSFAVENVVYGSGGVLSLRVWLNGAVFNTQTSLVSFGALKVTVGRRTEKYDDLSSNIGISSNCYPLFGQIEMLAANTVFNELSTISDLDTEMYTISKTTEYDELGCLRKINVHQSGSSILSNTIEYKTNGSNISEQVSSETIKFGNEYTIRGYTTDALGRITKINDTKFGSHIYTYDYRGFLTKADSETFEYDANGNITKYDGAVFGYDSVIKDKLTKVGDMTVGYANAASLNPTSWGKNRYTYEGRRLTSIELDIIPPRGRPHREKFNYEYDEQGHRIRKTQRNYVTEYTYSGDKLVIEDGTNGKLFFLYDENGQLYGFVKDEKKYFYIKDITGTIYGIVDESGMLVGKYEYSAYGKCTILLDTDKIATINPFRFKCYYYDRESGMYYCHTRYFVPEWGRWLNADTINNLKFGNINGLNLFAYCSNDPVMYVDPKGTFGFLIGLLIAAVAALVIDTVVETTVLMTSEQYKAENVITRDPDTGKVNGVQINNSAAFNNPIAQWVYSSYLHKNVKNDDGTNFFTGDVYDIVGEWQAHNFAAIVTGMGLAITAIPSGVFGSGHVYSFIKPYHISSVHVNLGNSLAAEERGSVRGISQFFKWYNKIFTLNILNW